MRKFKSSKPKSPQNKSSKSIFLVGALFVFLPSASQAQTSEPRLALVIGNAQYPNAPLATTANDAGLIAQTLTTAGFEVTGAADLDQESIRRAFRDFLGKVQAAGPHAVTFVYLAGYGLQYSGDNYFVPVDATLARDTDIPVEAIRLSDFTRALDGMPTDARIFVLDAARENPFPVKGNPLAGGLALVDAENNGLDAFNAAPGTVATVQAAPYGVYARALAEMLRYGGVPIDEVFARTRLRVNELTHGAFVPWDVSKLTRPLILLAANPDAAAMPAMQNYREIRARPIRDFPDAREAYAAAVEIDTLSAYQEFLGAYPSDPLAGRVRGLLAARREALTWNRTVLTNTPDAYWSYMRRYPRGPHFYDARRRLSLLSVALEPPPRFTPYDFEGLPPPPQDEYVIIDRPVLMFDGPDYAPAPPPPAYFLPPPPPEFRRLPPPEPRADGVLPFLEGLALPFARPAQRPGSISQPNFTPAAGQQGGNPGRQPPPGGAVAPQVQPNGAVPAGVAPNALPGQQPAVVAPGAGQPGPGAGHQPGAGHPGAGQPGAPVTEGAQPHQDNAPNHVLPVPPTQPGAVTPQVAPVHPNGAEPAGTPSVPGKSNPDARPGHHGPNAPGAPGHTGHPTPGAVTAPIQPQAVPAHPMPHKESPHAVETPKVAAPQVAPHVAPPHVPPPHVAPPHVEAPHPAPHIEAPKAAPPPVPHVAPPAPHPAAAPPHPAAAPPPAAAHPAPPKPGEKAEPPH